MAVEEPPGVGTGPTTDFSKQGGSAGGQGTGPSSVRDRPREGATVTSPRPGTLAGTRFPTKPDAPRSSEPILIPKLRIQFADFPYLHYSID